jgi:hypothetical protein
MQKKYDVVATVGSYQKNGETKNKYKNVGGLFEKDGNQFLLLDKTFNLAGMPGDKESVLLSLFTPKEDSAKYAPSPTAVLDDEVPFN